MYQLDSSHVWHVAKSGNDANSGHAGQYPVNLANDAKLTIGATITAASAGDTIVIWPGTYAENVVLNKQLQLKGTSREKCLIQPSTGQALAFASGGEGSHLKDLNIKSGTGDTFGINMTTGGDRVVIENCDIWGRWDGIYNVGDYCRIYNCIIGSYYDGLMIAAGKNVIVDNCLLYTDGSEVPAAACGTALKMTSCEGVLITNTVCYATMAQDGDDYDVAGISISGQVVLENVSVRVKHTGTGQHDTIGMLVQTSNARVSIKNVAIEVVPSYGYGYGIEITNGVAIINGAVINVADPTNTSGSVTAQVGGFEKTKFRDSALPAFPDDYINEWWVIWTSGNNIGEVKEVLDYVQSTREVILVSACTNDIEVGDEYTVVKYIKRDIKQTGGVLRVANCQFDRSTIEGTIIDIGSIADADGRVDVSKLNGSGDSVVRLDKATKLLTNKAIQTKSTGVIQYYDDDGETVILTHTPADGESIIERTPS